VSISIKKKVNKLEAKYAKDNGMKKCLASGATIWGKGDCVDDVFMVDLKTTSNKKSIILKKTDLEKAYRDAITYNPPRIPVIHIDMDGFECDVLLSGDFQYLRELALNEEEKEKE
jgi:hypothetical protein